LAIGDWRSKGIDTSTNEIGPSTIARHRAIVHRSPIDRCRLSMHR
jgi:hypothetical protein